MAKVGRACFAKHLHKKWRSGSDLDLVAGAWVLEQVGLSPVCLQGLSIVGFLGHTHLSQLSAGPRLSLLFCRSILPVCFGRCFIPSVALLQIWMQPLNWVSPVLFAHRSSQSCVCPLPLLGCLSSSAPLGLWASLAKGRGAASILFGEPTFKIQVGSSELQRCQACCHTESHRTPSFLGFAYPGQPMINNNSGVRCSASPGCPFTLPSFYPSWISTGNDPTPEIRQELFTEPWTRC